MFKKRRIFYLLLAFIFTFNIMIAYADESVNELKNKQKDVKNQIDEKKKEIQQFQSQSKDISIEIDELDRKMDVAATQLDKVENELEKLNVNIKKTIVELDEAENKISDKQDTFNSRLRVMYKNGNVGYLEVLLSSANIRDFLTRKEMITSIADHDASLIKFMKEQRDVIQKKKTELQAQRASAEVTKSKIESRKKDLVKVSREKEALMGRLQQDIKEAEKQYDKLNDYAKEIESKIVSLQRNTGPYSGGTMAWPVPGHSRISSYYGYRVHPVYKTKKLHTGIDIPAPIGTSVKAASDGIVIYSGWLGGYGKAIMIDHGGGIVTLYGHNSSLTASDGQEVSRGDTIAKIGSTGISTGPHCHFEVRKNGAYVDPIPWLKGK